MSKDSYNHQSFQCSQLFGYRSLSEKSIEQDKITALKFNQSGHMLALGDRAGRIIIFNAVDNNDGPTHYDYYFQFQSHERQFDTLKSFALDEQINHICWFSAQDKYNKLLTSNSNSIKLWKLYQKSKQKSLLFTSKISQFQQQQQLEPIISINLKKVIPNVNSSLINTLQISKNQQYIFATNDQTALLWSVQNHNNPYILKQFSHHSKHKKRENNQKITCSQLHPETQNMFIIGTNKGGLQFNDSRASLHHAHTLSFQYPKDHSNFLSELISNYSSVSFIQGTRKIITRDLISIKIWDMCNNRQPLVNQYLDENLKTKLCDLFEADCLDDKFSISSSKGSFVTGNYSNSFHLIDSEGDQNFQYQLDFEQQTLKRKVGEECQRKIQFDSSQKVLNHDFNQRTGQIAVSTRNCFFIFSQSQ